MEITKYYFRFLKFLIFRFFTICSGNFKFIIVTHKETKPPIISKGDILEGYGVKVEVISGASLQ